MGKNIKIILVTGMILVVILFVIVSGRIGEQKNTKNPHTTSTVTIASEKEDGEKSEATVTTTATAAATPTVTPMVTIPLEQEEVVFSIILPKEIEFNAVELTEVGSNVRKYDVEVLQAGEWKKVYSNDLIESYHLCVLDETFSAQEIRVVVKESENTVSLEKIKVKKIETLKVGKPFVNVAYLSDTYYEHDWDGHINNDNFKNLTDLILIGTFCFTKDGEFVIVKDGNSTSPVLHPSVSQEAKDWITLWLGKVTDKTDARIWLSVTCWKKGEQGAENGETDAFNTIEKRSDFIQKLITFAKENGIAGYDIDWEYPTGTQWQDYDNLIQEASVAFHDHGLLLSSAQSPGSRLSVESLNALDRINLMAYDNKSTYAATYHSTFKKSTVEIIDEFLKRGIPEEKLILGLPYYGVLAEGYTTQTDYSKIYTLMKESDELDRGINRYYNPVNNEKTGFLQGNWGFNGAYLIRDKVVYAMEKDLGGVFCWQMKNDIPDFKSEYSLAGTVKRTIERFMGQ